MKLELIPSSSSPFDGVAGLSYGAPRRPRWWLLERSPARAS